MRLSKLIRKIKKNKKTKPNNKKPLRIILGNSSYPQNNNLSTANIDFYRENGFKEVAFLTNQTTDYTLDLISILSIIFDSTDYAAKFILSASEGKITYTEFVNFLVTKNIILINRFINNNSQKNNDTYIKNLIKDYNNSKFLIIGIKTQKNLNYVDNNYLCLYHCSSQAYANYSNECIESYFFRNYVGNKKGNISIKDFKL